MKHVHFPPFIYIERFFRISTSGSFPRHLILFRYYVTPLSFGSNANNIRTANWYTKASKTNYIKMVSNSEQINEYWRLRNNIYVTIVQLPRFWYSIVLCNSNFDDNHNRVPLLFSNEEHIPIYSMHEWNCVYLSNEIQIEKDYFQMKAQTFTFLNKFESNEDKSTDGNGECLVFGEREHSICVCKF